MWDTIGLRDVRQYSNGNSIYSQQSGLHCPRSRKNEVKLVLELNWF